MNLVLITAAVLVAAFYIFISNFLVAQRYAMDAYKAQLNQINAKPGGKELYGTASDLKGLLLFAKKSGMVEAKDTDHIVVKNDFALNRGSTE